MPVPVAFPLASFLARAGITALGTGAATEGIKSLQNQGVVNPNMAQQALMRTIMGPTSEIFNRTTDTPSGKVFAPTGEVIEPNQIPGIAPPEQQQGITGLPIPEQQQGITGLPIPEKAPGLPGLINPEQVDTSILNKEETPEQPVKPGSSVENLTEDQSVNLKGLVSRSVGQEKGMKAIDAIYNDRNFSDVLTPDQQQYINDLEYSYVGGVGNLGNPLVPAMFMNPTLTGFQEYMEGYQEKLADVGKKELGSKFKAYRLMDKNTAMKMMQGEIPNTKVMQYDEEAGQDKLVDYEYEGIFGKTTVPQEAMGFSLSPKQALAFRDFSFSGARQKKDEDFVLMEYDASPTDIVMRGHGGEKELVLRTGDALPKNFTIYDINFLKTKTGRDIKAIKNKEFEKMKQDYESKRSKPIEKNTSKSAGSLTEVSTNPSEPFDNTDTSAVDFFPFNPIDFKKNGILNNPEIVKAFDDLKNDVKIKPPVGFNEDYMALQQSDSFYLTPPRAQMEITLKYLEKQLEENKASEETLNLIKNLNKDLQAKIKDTGYYAENKKVEDRITNLPGMTNKLKKLKSSN
jgi:hypothetical protein